MFFKNFDKFRNEIAIIDNDIQKKYKDLQKDINKICNIFDFEKRKLCFLISENSYNFIKIYLALIKLNYVIILLENKIDNPTFKKLIDKYMPNYLFIPNGLNLNIKSFFKKVDNYLIYKNSILKHKFNDGLQLLLPTSGTTGSSKFVMLTKKNLYKNTNDIIKYLKLNKKSKTLSNLPFHYSYGLSVLNTHLLSGARLIIYKDSLISNNFRNFFKHEYINCFYGVPENYEILKRLNLNLKKSFKFFAIAGGKISKITLNYLLNLVDKQNINIFNMYGQTEASPRISFSCYKNTKDKKHIFTSGKTFGGGKIFIKKNGKKIKKKQIGKIFFSGKNVMLGYANSYKDLKNKRKNNYILDTGDLGYLDDNYNLNIVGRDDRFIKLDSERINLDDIEDKLYLNFRYKYLVIYMNNKINLLSEKKKSNESEVDFLSSTMKIKKNYLKVINNVKFHYLSNGKLNLLKIKKDYLITNSQNG